MKVQSFLDLLNDNRNPKIWKFETGVNNDYPIIDYTTTMAVSETQQSIKLSIYPTIAKDKIYLSDKTQVYNFEVIDFTGKILQSGKAKALINVEGLAKGIYLLRLNKQHTPVVHKFIKN